ncbi:MAG: hypothetical protein H0X65_16560 [Gemmatimonadetes bacterium]|nr:hypothetical protein [Gemmatimonadota bacterium]
MNNAVRGAGCEVWVLPLRMPVWIAVLAALLTAAPLAAQVVSGTYNPRDDQYRMLGLVRAQSEYERAEGALERARQLHDRELISTQELEDRRAAFERARVDYLQQSLAVATTAPHVAIERATKRRAADGRGEVHLTLRVMAAEGAESARFLEMLAPEVLTQLDPGTVSGLSVSLKAEPGPGGTIISQPYERRLPTLRAGRPATVAFHLLRDADEVVVSLQYADRVEERKVLLEMDASAEIVAVQSAQFSQEADLGGQAVYDLRLERFTSRDDVFRLAVIGLPHDVRHEFRDPQTGARLNQIRFPGGENQRDLQLVLSLPQRASDTFRMDEPIRFQALALDETAGGALDRLRDDPAGTAELESLRAGKTQLELLPRGVGRIQVRAMNLYHEIRASDSVAMDVTVRNVGSRALSQVRVRLDAPTDWQARVDPEFIPELPTNGEQRVSVVLLPPGGVVVGDYEARLRTESAAADRRVEVDDKTIRIHVASAANWLGTGMLVLLLAGLVAGVVVAGVRLAKR